MALVCDWWRNPSWTFFNLRLFSSSSASSHSFPQTPPPPTVFYLLCSIFESCFDFLKCLRCVFLFGLGHSSRRSWLQSKIAPQYLPSMLLTHLSSILFRRHRSLANIYKDKCGWTGLWNDHILNITHIFPIISKFVFFIFIWFFCIFSVFLQLNF